MLDGLDLLGAISPAQYKKEAAGGRAKTAGQRAIAAGQRIAKRAPRLSRAVMAAGQKALGYSTMGPKSKSNVATPLSKAINAPANRPVGPSGALIVPVAMPRGGAFGPPIFRDHMPAGVVGPRATPRGSAAGPLSRPAPGPQMASGPTNRVQPKSAAPLRSPASRPAPGPQMASGGGGALMRKTRVGEESDMQMTDAHASLAEAATAVADFIAAIQERMTALPANHALLPRGQNIIDVYQMTFGAKLEAALSGAEPVNRTTQDIIEAFQSIMDSQGDTSRPPWDWFALVDSYLDAHPPADQTGATGANVVVSPPSAVIEQGASQQFVASVMDAAGKPISATVTWSVQPSGPGASIDSSGSFFSNSIGSYTVTATADSGATGTASVTVQLAAASGDSGGGGGGGGGSSTSSTPDDTATPDEGADPYADPYAEYADEDDGSFYGPYPDNTGVESDPFSDGNFTDESMSVYDGASPLDEAYSGQEYATEGAFSDEGLFEDMEIPAGDEAEFGGEDMTEGVEVEASDDVEVSEGEGGDVYVGKGGGKGGKGGGHHGHHHGRGRRGWGGGGWGPWYPQVIYADPYGPDLDDAVASVDEVADEVARRLQMRHGIEFNQDLGEGLDILGAEGPRTQMTSQQMYEALKRLPVSELQVRADRVVKELRAWQTSVLANDNAKAYAATLEQATWQKGNGDSAKTDDEKRLAYARCVHMAEDALRRFTSMGPGDTYWDTYIETAEQMRDWAQGAPGKAVEWFTGIPPWALYTGGAALIGGVGYGAWKLLLATAPAVAGVAARRYMP